MARVAGGRPRRVAVRLSRVDTEAVASGGKAAWDEQRPLQVEAEALPEPVGESARDRQLRADVPPHW